MVSWDVITVDSLNSGLEVSQVAPPHVFLMDAALCNGNSVALIKKLQDGPFEQQIPIIALTESARPLNPVQLDESGIVAAFPQLLDPVILVRQIARLLEWPLPETI